MRTLYLDLGMGIAGDMFSAALFDLLNEDQRQGYLKTVNSLGLDGVRVSAETVSSSGICGVHMRVLVHGQEEVGQDLHEKDQEAQAADSQEKCQPDPETDRHEGHQLVQGTDQHEDCQPEADRKGERLLEHRTHESEHSHTHHGIVEIHHIVAGFDISEEVKSHILAIYGEIAKAESAVHGMPVEEIHFHEVGSLDAIVDVTSACLLMDMLAADRVTASPVRVGYGQVRAAHGLLPRLPRPRLCFCAVCLSTRARSKESSAHRQGPRSSVILSKTSVRCLPCACLRSVMGSEARNTLVSMPFALS